jgi:S-adenosylmethionine hydrolase
MPPITLLTDFGTADGYVAELKGVLATLAPDVPVLDLAHDLAAHDIEGARLVVARSWHRFPPGTVHVVVVDPGVGSARQALAVESDGRWLVGPDNGVLSPGLLRPGARAVVLPVPQTAAPTFHGRDVFAPAAARLATGTPLEALGAPAGSPVVRRTPAPQRRADGWVEGVVLAIDRFGNAVTNLPARGLHVAAVGGLELPVVGTYADLPPGGCGALGGSSGLLELACREGRADVVLALGRGTPVRARPGAA